MDPNQVRESIAKASTLNFDIMLPGHGEILKPNASEEIKKFNETLKQK
jgi:flavorubredoxin